MKYLLGITGFLVLLFLRKKNTGEDNRYFPVQSTSERVAGHPIVGAS